LPSQLIPVTNAPDQTLSVSLSIDSRILTVGLRLRYSEVAGYWVLSISDRTGNLLVDSVPVVCGWYPAANLLQQYAYLQIGSLFCINASSSNQDYPDQTTLGQDFLLLWDDTPTF
jgi:hypothetical protein